jgi:hypothetical protein
VIDKKKKKDFETIGKMVVAIGESGNIDKKRLYRTAFIKGVFSGLGGVVGATMVVSFLVWLFTLFGDVPLLGRIVDLVNNSLPK